ncbi:hypothetical protein [Spongiibacter thalassae]|uniref:hypothetical protein n=1 Tax=Spongiibacter thalassae TaxID=2721624 RepID=UPI001B2FEAF7|nr:hypothetical protein [Spongiibacter thalassae]
MMKGESSIGGCRWLRVLLAGPLVVLCALLTMVGASVWMPAGAAQLNNVAIPLLLLPLIWGALFFYACLTSRLGRACGVIMVLTLLNGGLVIWPLNVGQG